MGVYVCVCVCGLDGRQNVGMSTKISYTTLHEFYKPYLIAHKERIH